MPTHDIQNYRFIINRCLAVVDWSVSRLLNTKKGTQSDEKSNSNFQIFQKYGQTQNHSKFLKNHTIKYKKIFSKKSNIVQSCMVNTKWEILFIIQSIFIFSRTDFASTINRVPTSSQIKLCIHCKKKVMNESVDSCRRRCRWNKYYRFDLF